MPTKTQVANLINTRNYSGEFSKFTKIGYYILDYSDLAVESEEKLIEPTELEYYQNRFNAVAIGEVDTSEMWGRLKKCNLKIKITTSTPKTIRFFKKSEAMDYAKSNYDRLSASEAAYNENYYS